MELLGQSVVFASAGAGGVPMVFSNMGMFPLQGLGAFANPMMKKCKAENDEGEESPKEEEENENEDEEEKPRPKTKRMFGKLPKEEQEITLEQVTKISPGKAKKADK